MHYIRVTLLIDGIQVGHSQIANIHLERNFLLDGDSFSIIRNEYWHDYEYMSRTVALLELQECRRRP